MISLSLEWKDDKFTGDREISKHTCNCTTIQMINILPLTKKNYKYKLYFDTCNQVIFLHTPFIPWNLSYEIIQFEVNKNVFFTSNEIIDGKWIDARAITMYTGIFVIKLEYHNKL